MKIGIMTYWGAQTNYGQVLQCYALQEYLRTLGHDTFVIRYDREKDIIPNNFLRKCLKIFNPIVLYSYLESRFTSKNAGHEKIVYNRHFDDFRNKYISQSDIFYKSFNELKKNPPNADLYITGSDQVWNYWNIPLSRYRNLLHSFFLDFGDSSIKRVSYAASWGITKLPIEYKNEIKPLLTRFNYVSVRELSGIELCRQCGYENAKLVIDPTMLLTADTYRKLYRENGIRNLQEKYLFLYLLNDISKSEKQAIFNFAKQKELSLIYVSGNNFYDSYAKYYANIPEWINLIDNAEYVITNSYHGCIFSIIFKKKFGIIPLAKKNANGNDRFNSLFQILGINNRYIKNLNLSILDEKYTIQAIPNKDFLVSCLRNENK